jgi:hypothetical protein
MSIAHLVWRKQNLMTLHIAERAESRYSTIRNEDINKRLEMAILEIDEEEFESREEEKQTAKDRARIELGDAYELAEVGKAATFDGLTKELDIRERLDSAIARCLKQLLMVRGLKSISATPAAATPKRIPGPAKAA